MGLELELSMLREGLSCAGFTCRVKLTPIQYMGFLSTDTALRVHKPEAAPDIFLMFPYCLQCVSCSRLLPDSANSVFLQNIIISWNRNSALGFLLLCSLGEKINHLSSADNNPGIYYFLRVFMWIVFFS